MLLADLFALSPTPTPLPLINTIAAPILTINPFYDAKKRANPMITLSGTTNPDAELDITITPDNVMTTVTADSLGNWRYAIPKKLKNGNKQLTIIAHTANGGQATKTETFTVVGGFQFPLAAVVFTLILGLGVGGYILYMKKMAAKNTPPPPDQYASTTPTTFVPPEATPSEEQPTLGSDTQGQTPTVAEIDSTQPVETTQTENSPS